MSLQTAPDIIVQIIVPSADPSSSSTPLISAERRITPSWTILQLKGKLEPITGIPSTCQTLRTKTLTGTLITLSDEASYVGDSIYNLRKGSEIEVIDSRPPAARQNFTDVSAVEKYEMPVTQYEQLDDTVLAWKRRQKLGRFDPRAKSAEEMKADRNQNDQENIKTKGIQVGQRCRVGGEDTRRGTIRFVDEVPGLGGEKEAGCVWVGVELDEPVGRNNGSVMVEATGSTGDIDDNDGIKNRSKPEMKKRVLFTCGEKYGVFARPDKIEVGEWPPLDDFLLEDEDMEEL